ncbi:hypothetical protein HYT23_00700 [Candidatus Pacearchaeota archaeon]|nr:hypothetical protein [Candidatus Pacearchaeota archaeon]
MTIRILSKHETQAILSKLQEQFGIKQIPGILLRIGQERIFLYQGSLNEKQIKEHEKEIPIERLGVYFAKEQEDGIRLSIEGTQILQSQITKNIYNLDETQLEPWMKGNEILLDDYAKSKFDDNEKNDADDKYKEIMDKNKLNVKELDIKDKLDNEKKDVDNKNNLLTLKNKSSEPSNLTLAKSVSNNQSQVMSKSEPNIGWASDFAKRGAKLDERSREFGWDKTISQKPNKGFVIIKHKDDFLGTGKASELKISNFIPKNRRLRERG